MADSIYPLQFAIALLPFLLLPLQVAALSQHSKVTHIAFAIFERQFNLCGHFSKSVKTHQCFAERYLRSLVLKKFRLVHSCILTVTLFNYEQNLQRRK